MHIAFVLTQSMESPSALGRYGPISRELVRLGYRVSVIAPHHDYGPHVPDCELQDGVEIWCSGQMHVRKIGARKTYFAVPRLLTVALRSAWRTARLMHRIRPDAIHLGKPHPINGLAAWWALAANPSLQLYVDCDDYEAEANQVSAAWQRRVLVYFENSLPRRARAVSVNTRFTQQRLEALGVPPDHICYVPNGVDRRRFAREKEIDRSREWLVQGERDEKRVLYLGSLNLVNHSIDLLLDAFTDVHEREPSASLLIVGGGSDYDLLQVQARQRQQSSYVRFLGVVSPAEAPSFYRAAHLSVDPVWDDSVARARSPLKVVESLAAGTPVVTGDVGDRRWMLGDGEAGVVVEPGNSRALADGILRVLQNDQLARELQQGAVRLRNRYWWDALVRAWEPIYRQRAESGDCAARLAKPGRRGNA